MDFSRLDRVNQRIFRKITKSSKDSRILIYHPRFSNFLSAITDVNSFKEIFAGIQSFTDNFSVSSNICIVFLIPPSIPVIKHIIHCLEEGSSKGFNPPVEIWFQPRINEIIKAFLVDVNYAPSSIINSFPTIDHPASAKGAKPNDRVSVFDLGIDLVTLDKDVISMGNPYSFLHAFSTDRDLTIVSDFRRALDSLSQVFGGFLSIHAFGSLASSISRTLPPPNGDNSTRLIILDRTADLLTPIITQMGYEGLIAEFFGIDYATVEIPAVSGHESQLELLSSKYDPLFSVLCCLNQQEASDEIQRRTQEVSSKFNTTNTDFSKSVATFKEQSQVALENKTLVDHLNIIQLLLQKMKQSPYFKTIMNIEVDAIAGDGRTRDIYTSLLDEGAPLAETLRVACLEYLLRGSVQDYPSLARQLVVNFGFQMYPYLTRLQAAGLLGPGSGPKWSSLIKPLQVYVPDWEKGEVDSAAAIYEGYAPISIRLVEKVVRGEFSAAERLMRGTFVDDTFAAEVEGKQPSRDEGCTYVVVFVGGCTHSELNSLRRIEQKGKNSFRVVTSDLFSSKTFFANMGESIPGFKTEVEV